MTPWDWHASPAGEYVETSALGAALAALMRRGRSSEELELCARMLKRVVSTGLDEGRQFLLVNVIETYFELSVDERERFRRLLSRKEYHEVREAELTWADRLRNEGMEKGVEKGVEKGFLQGKRDTLVRLLTARFGLLPREIAARIDTLSSVDELDRYIGQVLTAATLEEMGLCG